MSNAGVIGDHFTIVQTQAAGIETKKIQRT